MYRIYLLIIFNNNNNKWAYKNIIYLLNNIRTTNYIFLCLFNLLSYLAKDYEILRLIVYLATMNGPVNNTHANLTFVSNDILERKWDT